MSIFGINDSSSSAYSSILSKSKENKENNQVKFVHAMIKDNVTKLSGIQTQNTFTLAKNEILNSNPLDNPLQNSIYALKYKQGEINKQSETNQAVSMAYGYGVDSQGYMTSDFNKAAGLPEDFKIHKSTLEEIERAAENSAITSGIKEYLGVDKYYTNIDMADTIKQYYNLFSNALDKSFPSNKTSFSEADLESLPKGYSVSGIKTIDFNDPNNRMNITHLKDLSEASVANIYRTSEQMKEASSLYIQSGLSISGIEGNNFGLSLQDLKETYTNGGNDWEFNPDMSVYSKNEKGEYPKEALFMSFLRANGGQPVESSKTTLNPRVEAYNTAMAKESFNGFHIDIDDIMTGKVDFTSLLKADALGGWLDGDIYAYENGVKWQDSSIGYGGAWFDRQFNQAKANGWKASSESINSYVTSVMDRLNNLINQTRA